MGPLAARFASEWDQADFDLAMRMLDTTLEHRLQNMASKPRGGPRRADFGAVGGVRIACARGSVRPLFPSDAADDMPC